jgi:hypothetical protein
MVHTSVCAGPHATRATPPAHSVTGTRCTGSPLWWPEPAYNRRSAADHSPSSEGAGWPNPNAPWSCRPHTSSAPAAVTNALCRAPHATCSADAVVIQWAAAGQSGS